MWAPFGDPSWDHVVQMFAQNGLWHLPLFVESVFLLRFNWLAVLAPFWPHSGSKGLDTILGSTLEVFELHFEFVWRCFGTCSYPESDFRWASGFTAKRRKLGSAVAGSQLCCTLGEKSKQLQTCR